ncbi:radical SAM protein [Desulfurococcus mucosus]|uniref:Radical SAM domain protein n=1 Tax=Desulfurococcus mucosus (strain ATCC 35584 / DSM 2162 / JCM 9187 / O7/1) TaxID=765177 RepID=E8R9U2_DESM0|nr:radical SAM protein [Desulfurococcus mucosus]ADV65268.1 radical SAM domain protein [Desulfurococcus mucosus DSM 2162]
MRPFISFFYGVHPSRCHGPVVNIDVLLPPRKCPLNCFHCPLPGDGNVPRTYVTKIDVNHLKAALEEYSEVFERIKKVRLWGFGDPLLIENLPDVAKVIKGFMTDGALIVHSSGVTLSRAMKTHLVEMVDEISVPFPWCSGGKALEASSTFSLNGLINLLRLFPERDKLILEIVAARRGSIVYPDPMLLHELSSCLSKTGVERIRVKTLTRPPFNEEYKPVPSSILNTITRHLIEEGFQVVTCTQQPQPVKGIRLRGLQGVIYNHVLREPLSTSEVLTAYGDNGLIAVDNIVEKQWAVKVVWENTVYYRGRILY